MGNNNKHTEGTLYIGGQNSIRADNGQAEEWQHETVFTYTGGDKSNAERLVTMWNNWDEVLDLIGLAKHDMNYLLKEIMEIHPGSYRATSTLDKLDKLTKLLSPETYTELQKVD